MGSLEPSLYYFPETLFPALDGAEDPRGTTSLNPRAQKKGFNGGKPRPSLPSGHHTQTQQASSGDPLYSRGRNMGWRGEGPAQASVTHSLGHYEPSFPGDLTASHKQGCLKAALPGWSQRTKAQPGWSVVPVRLESQHGTGPGRFREPRTWWSGGTLDMGARLTCPGDSRWRTAT